MTRREFEEQVENFYDLKDFCGLHGCELCDDVYDDGERNDYINEQVRDALYDYGWEGLTFISDLSPSGEDFWVLDDYGDWYVPDEDDFEERKSSVLQWAIENSVFDDAAAATGDRDGITADGSFYTEDDSEDSDLEYDAPDFGVDDLFIEAASGYALVEEARALMEEASAAAAREEQATMRAQQEEQAAVDARAKAELDVSFLNLLQAAPKD